MAWNRESNDLNLLLKGKTQGTGSDSLLGWITDILKPLGETTGPKDVQWSALGLMPPLTLADTGLRLQGSASEAPVAAQNHRELKAGYGFASWACAVHFVFRPQALPSCAAFRAHNFCSTWQSFWDEELRQYGKFDCGIVGRQRDASTRIGVWDRWHEPDSLQTCLRVQDFRTTDPQLSPQNSPQFCRTHIDIPRASSENVRAVVTWACFCGSVSPQKLGTPQPILSLPIPQEPLVPTLSVTQRTLRLQLCPVWLLGKPHIPPTWTRLLL